MHQPKINYENLQKFISLIKKKLVYSIKFEIQNYNNITSEISKHLTNTLKLNGIYVTLNNPYFEVVNRFKEINVHLDQIFFIDVTNGYNQISETNCINIKGKSLTDLSLTISKILKDTKIDFIVFDPINTLLVYHDIKKIEKFLHYIVNNMKKEKILTIILTTINHTKEIIQLNSQISLFYNVCIEI